MDITLKHVVALGEPLDTDTPRVREIKAQFETIIISVEYDVTYHYDGGGWTDYGGDPPSHSLDINESKVVEWRIEGDDGTESPMLTQDMVQKLYDAWADKHGDEIEGELFDKIQDGAGDWDGD